VPADTCPFEQLTLDALRQRTSAKWRAFPDDVLPLWVAEMDVVLAEPVVRAISDAATRGDTGYSWGTAYPEALRDFAVRRWGWSGIDVARCRLVPDVMQGVVEVLRAITAPGSAVVVNPPVYPPFFAFIEHMDRRVVGAPLGADGRLDFECLGEAFAETAAGGAADAPRPAAYLLCNPHNPTGTVHSEVELRRVAELARRFGVRVIADEIHAPLVLPGARFTPYLSVAGTTDGFSLMSASKAWNLAGLKAAVAVAGPDAGDDLARLPEEVGHGVSHLGVLAHAAALRDGGDWLDRVLAGLAANRQLLADLLAEHLPAVRWTHPEATYLAWLDCSALATGDDPAAMFLRDAKVALTSGPAFGTGGAGHARLNFATSKAILADAVRRIAAALP
jgi:cystathionine beta-lyase